MAANKKKLEEKHAKILRDMAAHESNKHCFDCNQIGPTYVNMTIGSFICTQCSGLVRGLNTPHRVKSLNMATFSTEDMDFLKSHGNDWGRKVWLGLYDRKANPDLDTRNSQNFKDFLSLKYDKKKWYIAPTEEVTNRAIKFNQEIFDRVDKPVVTSASQATPATIPAIKGTIANSAVSARHPTTLTSENIVKSSVSTVAAAPQQSSTSIDLWAQMEDPNAAKLKASTNSTVTSNFNPFTASNTNSASSAAQFNGASVRPHGVPANAKMTPLTLLTPIPNTNTLVPQTVPMKPSTAAGVAPVPPPAAQLPISNGDKYAALAELDDLFSKSSINPSVSISNAAVSTGGGYNLAGGIGISSATTAHQSMPNGSFWMNSQIAPSSNPFQVSGATQPPSYAASVQQGSVFGTSPRFNQPSTNTMNPFFATQAPQQHSQPFNQFSFNSDGSFGGISSLSTSGGGSSFPSMFSSAASHNPTGDVHTASCGYTASNNFISGGVPSSYASASSFASSGTAAPLSSTNPFL